MDTTLRGRFFIGIVCFVLGTLVSCGTPATPEESCLSTSEKVVNEEWSVEDFAAIAGVTVIKNDPILCEGVAVFRDGSSEVIQFYENSDELGFYSTPISERKCDAYLVNEVIELSEERAGPEKDRWPVILKIYNPEEVSNTGDKLTCRGDALWNTSNERGAIEFYVEKDEDEDRFVGYEEK